MKKRKKLLFTVFKILISVLLLYFIIQKIDLVEIRNTLRHIHLGYFLWALILFTVSKFIAALRLNQYLHHSQIPLTHRTNVKLYALGMFYNLFLPGGIGGDAYKGFVIQQHFDITGKKIAALLLLDRISGMVALLVLALLISAGISWSILPAIQWLAPCCIPIGLGIYYVFHQKIFPSWIALFTPSLIYSLGVQLAQLGSVLFILKALDIQDQYLIYLLLFLLSSIVTILPLTIGGIGAREVTFYFGAEWFQIQTASAISISVLFFIITALVSLVGIIYHFKTIPLGATASREVE